MKWWPRLESTNLYHCFGSMEKGKRRKERKEKGKKNEVFHNLFARWKGVKNQVGLTLKSFLVLPNRKLKIGNVFEWKITEIPIFCFYPFQIHYLYLIPFYLGHLCYFIYMFFSSHFLYDQVIEEKNLVFCFYFSTK